MTQFLGPSLFDMFYEIMSRFQNLGILETGNAWLHVLSTTVYNIWHLTSSL